MASSVFFPPLSHVFIHVDKPWGFSSPGWTSQVSQLLLLWEVLQSLNLLCGPQQDSHQHACVPLVLVVQHCTQHSRFSCTSTEQRRISSFELLVMLATISARPRCILVVNSLSTIKSFLAKLFSIWLALAWASAWGYFSPGARLAFPFTEFLEMPAGTCLLSVEVPLAVQASNVSTTLFCLDHLQTSWGCASPSSTSLLKILNSTGPSTNSWGTPIAI